MTQQRWVIGILLLLSLAGFPQGVWAEESDFPQVKVETSWQGYVRYEGWIELLVTVDNPGQPWEGALRIADDEAQTTYLLPLDLAANAHKQYRVPLYLKGYRNISLSLMRSDGRQKEVHFDWGGVGSENQVCAYVGSDAVNPHSLLSTCVVEIALPSITQLPETAMAWDTVDVLILNGISTAELTPQQQQAMFAWVAMGGHLILGGGGALPQTLAGVPAQMQAVTVAGSQVATKFDGKHDLIIAQLQPVDDTQVLKTYDGQPVAVRKQVGYGTVDILAWDPIRANLGNWVQSLWAEDRVPATSFLIGKNTLDQAATPSGWKLLNFPKDKLPFKLYWLCLFPIYLGLMGPLTPLLAKRFRHPFAPWGLLFMWIGLSLFLLILVLSGLFSHIFPLVHENAVIYATGDGLPARVIQGTAIYAPRSPSLSWTEEGAPRPMRGSFSFDSSWMDGAPYPITIIHSYQRASMQTNWPTGAITWGTEGVTTSPREYTNLDFVTRHGLLALTGEISSSIPLNDVKLFIFTGQGNYEIPITAALEASTPLQVTQVLTDGPKVVHNWPQKLCSTSNTFIPAIMGTAEREPAEQPNRCILTGQADMVPFPAQEIKGTHSNDSCIIYPVPCPTQERTQVPVNLTGLAKDDVYVGLDEEGNVYLNSTEVTELNYTAPGYLQIQHITNLTLTLSTTTWQIHSGNTFNPHAELERVALWDWQAQKWINIKTLPTDETPITLQGTDVMQFFDSRRGVRVLLKAIKSEGASFRLTIQVLGAP